MTDWFKKYNYELLEHTKDGRLDFHKVFDISSDQVVVHFWNKNKPNETLNLHFYDRFNGLEIPKSLTNEQIFELVCSYYDTHIHTINPVRKLQGRFYIKLNKPEEIEDITCNYLLQVKDKDPHYIWFNGCCGPQFANKKYDCEGGYSTRIEAQQAIDKFHIDGKVYFDKGCGCCGFSYETLDGGVEHIDRFNFAEEEENYNENLKSYEKYIDTCEKKLELGIAFSEYEDYGKYKDSDKEILESFKEGFESWKKLMNCEHDFEFSEEDSKHFFFKCKKCGKHKSIEKEDKK